MESVLHLLTFYSCRVLVRSQAERNGAGSYEDCVVDECGVAASGAVGEGLQLVGSGEAGVGG